MNAVKSELTKLKNKFRSEFGDDYIFLNVVSLNNIYDELEKLYPFINKLEGIDNNLELIYIKRTSLKLIRTISRIIKKDEFTINDEVRVIGYLIKLKQLIKQSYLIEVEGQFRSEEELSALSSDIEQVKKELGEHISLEEMIKNNKDEFEVLKDNYQELLTDYENGQDKLDDIENWHTTAMPLKNDIASAHTTATEKLGSITQLSTKAENSGTLIKEYEDKLEKMTEEFTAQSEEIQKIIGDANRASMAGSFKKQQDDINRKMKWADGFLIGSLILTAGISLWGFKSSFSPENLFLWGQFFAKSAISLPLLIVAWIKAKERAYLFRLRENYAYKYSSAMAFEGYRKQVQEQSPDLQAQLLQIAIDNLGDDPTKIFEKEIKITPLETMIDSVGKRVDKIAETLAKNDKKEEE